MYIQYSPIVECLAKGVYCLRGAAIQPGVAEGLAVKGGPRPHLERDYGHLQDGRIWMVQELSKAAIDASLLYRPAGLRDYVNDGTYRVHLDGAPTAYEVKCSSNQLRFSRNMLSTYGSEPGDFALMVFDAKAKTLDVLFGDESVAEKLNAPADSPE
jgi:hypothetical protein